MNLSEIGVIGMGVMGSNLALNLADNKFEVSVYNRPHKDKSVVADFLKKNENFKNLKGFEDLKAFVQSLERPRKIIIMVKAGAAVDQIIGELCALVDKGDIIMDAGNSDFRDTARREKSLLETGIKYAGVGVSGGELGARTGASIMVGSSVEVWEQIKKYLLAIAAKLPNGEVCAARVGASGAGHFVKAVHNGIEYADMQLISEAARVLKACGHFSADELSGIFSRYNAGKLRSYLIEITSKIFAKKDEDGSPLVDKIFDSASQKGTGKLVVQTAVDESSPISAIAEAVFARFLSAMTDARSEASKIFGGDFDGSALSGENLEGRVENALFIAKVISYAQGFWLLKSASQTYDWGLELSEIAKIWRGGCIIRADFLDNISSAFSKNPELKNLLFDEFFAAEVGGRIADLRKFCSDAAIAGIGAPAFFSSLAYFDNLRAKDSGASLIQAMRDFFGAHTYERIDSPRGKFFHTNWD